MTEKPHWSRWRHQPGSAEYTTVDGCGKVIVRSIGFRTQYDAYVNDLLVGTRNQRGQAMQYVERLLYAPRVGEQF